MTTPGFAVPQVPLRARTAGPSLPKSKLPPPSKTTADADSTAKVESLLPGTMGDVDEVISALTAQKVLFEAEAKLREVLGGIEKAKARQSQLQDLKFLAEESRESIKRYAIQSRELISKHKENNRQFFATADVAQQHHQLIKEHEELEKAANNLKNQATCKTAAEFDVWANKVRSLIRAKEEHLKRLQKQTTAKQSLVRDYIDETKHLHGALETLRSHFEKERASLQQRIEETQKRNHEASVECTQLEQEIQRLTQQQPQ